MDITLSQKGIYQISSPSLHHFFSFISSRAFRFYEDSSPKSPCVETYPVVEEGVEVVQEEDIVIFSYQDIEVRIGSPLTIEVFIAGKKVLQAEDYFETSGDLDVSLAEKEGHKNKQSDFNGGGLKIHSRSPVYGLGERSGPLDKRGYDYINWNTDDPSAHVDTFKSLYQSIPFFILFDPEISVGVFLDNTYRTHFDLNKTDPSAVKISFAKGEGDYYFFFGKMDEVVSMFTSLTGRNPLCPYWALGTQQSRWSYPNKEKVDEVIQGYRGAGLPLSVVYLDIDYMDHYKDFTVDPAKFPDIASWLKQKKDEGIVIVPIIDAGVKAEAGYHLYDEGIGNGYFSTLNGEVYHNEVWPGDSVFPAFLDEKVQTWWATHIKEFLDLGFGGIWNDMNEPASFKGPLPLDVDMGGSLHEKAHNVYGHFMVKAGAKGFELASRRLFQLTRAGYAGTAAYSSSWAGDNQSIYDHLRLSLPQMMNMSLSGQAYIGVDIGGFGGDATPELLSKWAYASLLNPLYRNHSSLGTLDQEPYLLKGQYLEAYRKALLFRYRLRPALYTELFFAEKEGNVPLRPLLYNYPADERLINENTEIMLGKDLLLIPSLFPGEQKRGGYFPADFIHVETGDLYQKGDHIVNCDLLTLPLYFRKDGLVALEDDEHTLSLLWGEKEGAWTYLYEDQGDGLDYRKGVYNLYRIEMKQGRPYICYLHHGMESRYTNIHVNKSEFPFWPQESKDE